MDESGQPVAVGEMGRLLIRGRSGAASYWNNPEKTAQTMLGDWMNTGDTYTQDEAGYFAYCGRADDMLKVSGQWVSPAEVEGILFQHPAVLEAAVVGWEDDNRPGQTQGIRGAQRRPDPFSRPGPGTERVCQRPHPAA